MKAYFLACLITVACLTLSAAHAGDTLSIRLVHATADGTVDEALDDVKGTLTSLPFRGYRLLDSKRVTLPADQVVTLAGGYQLVCQGGQDNLAIRVLNDKRELVNSRVALKDGKPFVFTLLPGDGGRHLLVMLAK